MGRFEERLRTNLSDPEFAAGYAEAHSELNQLFILSAFGGNIGATVTFADRAFEATEAIVSSETAMLRREAVTAAPPSWVTEKGYTGVVASGLVPA